MDVHQTLSALLVCTVVLPPGVATAEEAGGARASAVEQEREGTIEEVTVVAERPRFGVEGDIHPVIYDSRAIQSLTVTSLSEVLDELEPELASGRGRRRGPLVVLVNGRPIASFREISNFPPEALEKVEVYPEVAALRFGFRADQKVINFVLRQRFRATTARINGGGSTDGGGESAESDFGYLHIRRGGWLNVNLGLKAAKPLHDSDRSVVVNRSAEPSSLVGNLFGVAGGELDPDLSALAGSQVLSATLPSDTSSLSLMDLLSSANETGTFDESATRTLVPAQDSQTFSATYTLPVTERVSATVSADYARGNAESELGLADITYVVPMSHPRSPFANDVIVSRGYVLPLHRDQDSTSLNANATFAGALRGWSWTWLNAYSRSDRDVRTDRGLLAAEYLDAIASGNAGVDPFAGPSARTLDRDRDQTGVLDFSTRVLVRGVLADTARGPVRTSASVAWLRSDRDTESTAAGRLPQTNLRRRQYEARLNVDVPVFDVERWGRFSANVNAELVDYSDFGQLDALGGGFTWRLNRSVRISGSYTHEEGAPTAAQLGDAVSRVPNRRVFDFVSGESADVIVVTGGNPQLVADNRRVFSVSSRFEPFDAHDLSLTVDYVDTDIDSPVLSFPSPSPEIEVAFPLRFARDATGRLVEFDTRPINLHAERRKEVRLAVRYARTIRSQSPADRAGK